jgi:hypothetical protein
MISDFEKLIYNTHLSVSRQKAGKPYKIRKDFNDIDFKIIQTLNKLSLFFNKHKEISLKDFFKASYLVYKDENYLDISFFNTLKAVKAYRIFKESICNSDPDSEDQLKATKDSMKKIFVFCQKNNIKLDQYIFHKTNNISTFLLHLKNRQVNVYSLFYYDDFIQQLNKTDKEVLTFMFENSFIEKTESKKIKFLNSDKCKLLVTKGFNKLKNILEKS